MVSENRRTTDAGGLPRDDGDRAFARGAGTQDFGVQDGLGQDAAEPVLLNTPLPKKRPLLRLVPWLCLAAMLAVLVTSLSRCAAGDEGDMRLKEIAPQAARMEKVSAQSSQAYQDSLAVYSQQKAREALASGGSFVAPATGVQERPHDPAPAPQQPRVKQVDPAPPPKIRVQEVPPAKPVRQPGRTEGQGNRQASRQPQGNAAMMRYLSTLSRDGEIAQGQTYVFNSPRTFTQVRSVAAVAQLSAQQSGKISESGLPGVRVGDILHALNRVTLDSDAPGPAMVEVVSGPYKGARVLGSFQRLNSHLVLRFNELVTPGGTVHAIQGYAIDPATDRTAVRSSVDHHTLARWGGLVAASFLEGFGDAVRRSGTSSYSTIYGSGSSVPDYNVRDELWIAAGKVGERAANVVEGNFARPPTVTLDSGTLMGVLLLRLPAARPNARSNMSAPQQVLVSGSGQAQPDQNHAGQTQAQIAAEQEAVRAADTGPRSTSSPGAWAGARPPNRAGTVLVQ